VAYILISIPFVEWPGSVIRRGLENFGKAVVFYFFVIKTVDSERKLKILVVAFLACQSFRVLNLFTSTSRKDIGEI